MEPTLIETPDALERMVGALSGRSRLALDVETSAGHAFTPAVCLLQFADAPPDAPSDGAWVVDALALGSLGSLAELLGSGGPRKLLHDAFHDARVLSSAGIALGNVLDTAVHARFLGLPRTGLASLLGERFGVILDKRYQTLDWRQRPLTDPMLSYLAGDVRDLGRLAEGLVAEVSAQGLTEEVQEETLWVLRQARAPEAPRPAWERVPGVQGQSRRTLAALQALAEVREALARERDTTPGRLCPNAALLALARARPSAPEDLRRYVRDPGARALAPRWLAAIEASSTAEPPSLEPALRLSREDIDARRARAAALTAWRQEEARRRGVDLQAVLPGHCLSDLAARGVREPEDLALIDGFGQCRVARYGPALVTLLGPLSP
ncbi:MAG: HRDC domain-containing protein [Deltaproteobacteria bacterium]|nr:HRDC domain-containing protein [Deltaproteobacteria bacterium]